MSLIDNYSSYQETLYSVDDVRDDLSRVPVYFQGKDYFEHALNDVSEYRKLDKEFLRNYGCFFIDDSENVEDWPDFLKNRSLGLVKGTYSVFHGRWIYPVYDTKRRVMGFCGWDGFTKNVPKYLDSFTYGYKAKFNSLFGMEELQNYYKDNKPVFVTEGIVDALYLRQNGFNALAALGSSMSKYVKVILNRFDDRLVMVPDNDEAGDSFVKQSKWAFKKSTVLQCKYGKDIDGCRKLDDGIYEEDLLKDLRNINSPFSLPSMFIRR